MSFDKILIFVAGNIAALFIHNFAFMSSVPYSVIGSLVVHAYAIHLFFKYFSTENKQP